MNMCKQRFAYSGSWCDESRAHFADLSNEKHVVTKTGGFPAEKGSTDCITRDTVDGF
jgi:hypothetical protein